MKNEHKKKFCDKIKKEIEQTQIEFKVFDDGIDS